MQKLFLRNICKCYDINSVEKVDKYGKQNTRKI